MRLLAAVVAVSCGVLVAGADEQPLTDVEVWNSGVDFYERGDVTNALRVLRPLMLSKAYGPRAAEVVAKLEFDRGNREEAARAAQVALRANPKDARANRNFTRAVDRLDEIRETEHINAVLKAAEGKDPGSLLASATEEARDLFTQAGTYRTNAAPRAVELADRYSAQAKKLSDVWIPVRQVIAQSVTNEEQAATIVAQIEAARSQTRKAARELGDLEPEAYATLSQVEHDFTRFLKLTILPPQAIDADLIAQSNAWLDVEAFNGRAWQPEALDYTRAFRAKFPMWARAYEQQAQADTNKPPFTSEAQAKVSALATELEKIQLESCEKNVPPEQERAIGILVEIRDLLPKDNKNGSGSGNSDANQQEGPPKPNEQQPDSPQDQPKNSESPEKQDENPEQQPEESRENDAGKEDEPSEQEQQIDAVLKKAQERTDEHEAEKKARMRKAPLPPNERDW